MANVCRLFNEFPKVYGYVPFSDNDEPYVLYDIGILDMNGDPLYLDEDGEVVDTKSIEICKTFKAVRRRYQEDIDRINSLRGFIQAYQYNYDGDDKFLPREEIRLPSLDQSLERQRDKYYRAYKALKTGFFEVGETQYQVKDVVSITSCHKENDERKTSRIDLSLRDPIRTVHVSDKADMDLVMLLFGQNGSEKRIEYK